jgi:pimeloyl-ACP methyl ester carboxylesterase
LAAFSLGGKFALTALEAFPEKVKRLTLLAPDGIKTSFWYSLATYPLVIRSLFKSMVLRPGRFHALAKFLNRVGLVDKGLLRFAELQMDTEEKRRRVYYSWVYFRHLTFDLNQIATLLNANKIPLLLIVGKFDRVIPARNMNAFLQKITIKQFEIVEAGHNDLIAASKGLVAK